MGTEFVKLSNNNKNNNNNNNNNNVWVSFFPSKAEHRLTLTPCFTASIAKYGKVGHYNCPVHIK